MLIDEANSAITHKIRREEPKEELGSFIEVLKNQNVDLHLRAQIYYYVFDKSSKENIKVFEKALNNIFADPMMFLDSLKENNEKKTDNKISDFYKNRLES